MILNDDAFVMLLTEPVFKNFTKRELCDRSTHTEGVELVLEPLGFPPARVFQKALFDAGIPATAFITHDTEAEYRRLKERGVNFRGEPKNMGPVIAVMFEDTCGNLIHLVQPLS